MSTLGKALTFVSVPFVCFWLGIVDGSRIINKTSDMHPTGRLNGC